MPEGPSRLVDLARETFDGALRAVVRYTVEDGRSRHHVEYLREDVEREREHDLTEYAAALARDHAFESIERDWHERIHAAGALRASVRVFEAEAAIRLHDGVGAGFSVHVDAEALPAVGRFVDAVDAAE